ncbi:hypothetical protein F9K50_02790 [bacterium]|nr:MAG: hypothetical protein F9K50_02790 [bacterium]
MGILSSLFGPKKIADLETWTGQRVLYLVNSTLPTDLERRLRDNIAPEIFARSLAQLQPFRLALFTVYFLKEIEKPEGEDVQAFLERYFQRGAYDHFLEVQKLPPPEAEAALEELGQETRYYFTSLGAHAESSEAGGIDLYALCMDKFVERSLGRVPARDESGLIGVEANLLHETAKAVYHSDKKWIWEGKAIPSPAEEAR